MITRITLDPAQYDERQTIGGGTVRDLMPFEGAVSYVTDGEQYGIEYEDGQIDWLGLTLSQAFGDGVEIIAAIAKAEAK